MRTFLGILVGLTSALILATVGLALTGYLSIVSEHLTRSVDVVDENGTLIFTQIQSAGERYRITFGKIKGEI